jgi:thiol:disulfide interchange protein DsbC
MKRFAIILALLASAAQATAADDIAQVRQKLLPVYPDVRIDQLSATPVPGLFELRVGPQVAYVSADGRFMVRGDLYDIKSNENITEARRADARLAAMRDVGEDKMVIFTPKQVKHTITVFTDIDCGYCRKLHREIDQYLAEGIRVRYMFFPRSGPDTDSWHKAEQVWCSADRKSALTKAKAGEVLNAKACSPNPVQQHYAAGMLFGVQGTPAIITDSGELVPGYVSAAELSSYFKDPKGS